MRMNRIKVLIGDKVRVKLDQYGERGGLLEDIKINVNESKVGIEICAKCKMVRRKGCLYVVCEKPKHKQRQR